MNENTEAADALQQYREMEARRRALKAPRFPPMPATPSGQPWRPVMAEQQQREYEQYIEANNLPF